MKKHSVIFVLLTFLMSASAVAQKQLIGPAPAGTQGMFHINNTTTNTATELILENNSQIPYMGSANTSLKFLGHGRAFQMYTNTYPACGAGYFHMAPISISGSPVLGIHFTGSRIFFSENSTYGSCGPSYTLGNFLFDGNIGTDGLVIGYNTSGVQPPSGHGLVVGGTSYLSGNATFNSKVLVGTAPSGTAGNIHINNTSSNALTNLVLENNSTDPYASNTEINFLGRGQNFKIHTSSYPNCGSGHFHMAPVSTGVGTAEGLHFTGGSIIFSENPTFTLCNVNYAVNANASAKYLFDGAVSSSGVVIGLNGSSSNLATFLPPVGSSFSFINAGNTYTAGTTYMKGNVSIGDSYVPAGYALSVNGKVIATEVAVKLRNKWGDFVFAPEFKLMSLSEVEAYVKKHSHLPGVPSAIEIENNGLEMGEMENILMQKVEQLTLYAIEQDKTIAAQKKKDADQQAQIDQLLKRLEKLENK
jgi:hypothetical protein